MVCKVERRMAMVCQVEERSGAPQMVVGCLWWRILEMAMVCLVEFLEVVRLEEMEVQGKAESWC